MEKEDKEILLRDLSARLPYEVKLLYNSNSIAKIKDRIEILRGITIGYTIWFETNYIHSEYDSTSGSYEHFKPYLRPMSSMTDEEKEELVDFGLAYWDTGKYTDEDGNVIIYGGKEFQLLPDIETYEWLNAHHFDYRGLIEKGIALPAPEGMYNKIEEEKK